ncbi:MAG: hypothetical protein AAF702_25995 [Chloroflexota bacterium]
MKAYLLNVSIRYLLIVALLSTTVLLRLPGHAQAASLSSTSLVSAPLACDAPTPYTTIGANADAIRDGVNEFRDAIGPLNNPHPINHLTGRRQINWDAAPDGVSAPNAFPGDFFNANFFPRARGIAFTTPDETNEFQLSATAASGEGIEFENIDPSYSSEFSVYSAERIFTALDNNVIDVRFYNPANPSESALVDSFGAIFTDVDLADSTTLRYYDADDNLVYTLNVPSFAGQEYLSLAGAKFSEACISRVRITSGNIGLKVGIQDGVVGYDVVAMDDFIYGEPQPITSCGLPMIYETTGSNPDEIRDGVNAYRDALGDLNAPAPFNNLDGRRQINWDAAPDSISAPNDFPGNFFNADVFPRARGIAFKTDGTGFELSATDASGEGVEFDNINSNYSSIFQTYSPERLFTAIGSNVVEANFYNPAQQTSRALTDGFGAVFTDVDLEGKTTIGYYDIDGKLLYKQGIQPKAGNEGLSFAGVKFNSNCVSFVKLTNGTAALGADVNDDPENTENPIDLVVMDDFIYGEPTRGNVCGTPEIFTAVGADAADIETTVESYRTALGDLNAFEPTNFADGRRQINWDAAPDAISAPNEFPFDFFNFNASPRARGIEFTTNGQGFQLSATEESGVGVEFENINPNGPAYFDTFSAERLFTPVGSNEVDAFFFDPANQSESALTSGFGAVFTDVDLANVTAIRYYDVNNRLVYAQAVPNFEGNQQESLSFAGLKFDSACVGRVRLVNGNTVLASEFMDDPENGADVVVMDDFIYGEPQPSQLNVNAAINLINVQGNFDRTPQDNAQFGVFTINTEFKNVGDQPIKNMSFVVTELNNENTLLNSTNEELGVGALLPIPATDLGTDEVLAPGETFNVVFEIGINQFRPFTLLVNAFGSIGADVDATVDLGWNYMMDSDPTVTGQQTDGSALYLPFISR